MDENIKIIKQIQEAWRQKPFDDNLSNLTFLWQYMRLYQDADAIGKPGKALDWGCLSGHFSYFLLKKGMDVTSFKGSGKFVFDELIKSGEIKLVQADLNEQPVKLPFSNNEFDYVFSLGVLEHVHETGGNEVGSLKEIERILKEGGVFVCYHLPNKYGLTELIIRIPFVQILCKDKFLHSVRYEKKDIEEIVSKTNLKMIKCYRYGFLPKNTLCYLPKNLINNLFFTKLFYFLDNCLSKIMPPLCTNWMFILKKETYF